MKFLEHKEEPLFSDPAFHQIAPLAFLSQQPISRT